MILRPNCKINLGLCVVGKRPDGYHNLETVFLPIPLSDELEIIPSSQDSFCLEGTSLDCAPQDNLVMRVLSMLRAEGFEVPPVAVRLKKNIPSGAGLGGGSSDAAFMMKGLNEMFSLGLTDSEMEERVARLGADCAIFIKNKAVFAEGIGNIFTPINLNLAGWNLVLVKPDDFISTREAYSAVVPGPAEFPLLRLIDEPVETWRGKMVNDFEKSVFPSHPVVANLCDEMYRMGASYAAMSGSGSTVYGLFHTKQQIPEAWKKYFIYNCVL